MALAEGTLVLAEKSIKQDGTRAMWTPPDGGTMYNWNLTVQVNGANQIGQVLSKDENNYPIPLGTLVIFETDWVVNYGTYKFKRVKDKAKAQSFAGGKGGKKFNKEQFIKEASLEVAIKYLKEVSNYQPLKVTFDEVINLSTVFAVWIAEQGDLFLKKKSYLLAIDTISLNEFMDIPITTNVALTNLAKKIYSTIEVSDQPQTATPPQAPAVANTPPPPPPPPPVAAGPSDDLPY